ncbi:hypothetical protein [Streptomyces sp. NPDC052727]|uniref:hypothetical protein n=1 Tax=unclassified Streptomyces TaxID=2593676 RepID=UPI00342BC1A2
MGRLYVRRRVRTGSGQPVYGHPAEGDRPVGTEAARLAQEPDGVRAGADRIGAGGGQSVDGEPDGRVRLNTRDDSPSPGNRADACSDDGGKTLAEPSPAAVVSLTPT